MTCRDVRIMLNVVVFPAPLGPRSAKIVSCDTPKLTLSTTLLSLEPNAFTTFRTRRASDDDATTAASSSTSLRPTAPPSVFLPNGRFFEELKRRGSTEPESTQTSMPNSTSA